MFETWLSDLFYLSTYFLFNVNICLHFKCLIFHVVKNMFTVKVVMRDTAFKFVTSNKVIQPVD